MSKWRAFSQSIKAQIYYYRALILHPQTPILSKWLMGIALAYLLSPIDIIPDFIPILGQLDDLIIVPCFIYLALLLIPEHVKKLCKDSTP
jgi:uncharacterized membrane protein YkvA (DUF1232 family)